MISELSASIGWGVKEPKVIAPLRGASGCTLGPYCSPMPRALAGPPSAPCQAGASSRGDWGGASRVARRTLLGVVRHLGVSEQLCQERGREERLQQHPPRPSSYQCPLGFLDWRTNFKLIFFKVDIFVPRALVVDLKTTLW